MAALVAGAGVVLIGTGAVKTDPCVNAGVVVPEVTGARLAMVMIVGSAPIR